MKLLRLIRTADPAGGGPIEAAQQLDKYLEALGHEVTMVTLDKPDAPWIISHYGKRIGVGPALGNYGYSRRLIPWLTNNASNYDAVIINGLWQYHGFAAQMVLKKIDVPYFVYPHGMLDPWFKHNYPIKHFKKLLYWMFIERKLLHRATAVLFTSEQERILARQSFSPYSVNEVVVNYGTALPTESMHEALRSFWSEFPKLVDKRIVLFLGRIHEKKGCDLLIRAFSSIASLDSNLRLMIAGPDQTGWKARLERLASEVEVADRVIWPGMLNGDRKWGAMMAASVFALPSHQENFGIAVAEALAVGSPVLISNKVNIWKEIEHDGAGFVGNDDLEGTIEVFSRLINTESETLEIMKIRAKNCFFNRFEIGAVANNLLSVIADNLKLRAHDKSRR